MSWLSAAARLHARPAEAWPEDLHWHKRMFRRSRFRWSGTDAVSIVTAMSGGQIDFIGTRGLRSLVDMQGAVDNYAHHCRQLMVAAAQDAAHELDDVQVVADSLEVAPVQVARSTWVVTTEEVDARVHVHRVLTGIPLTNPLTQAWELKQLWRLYIAARTVLEDTICDLVDEADVDEHALVAAAGMDHTDALRERVEQARSDRGGPGDPRRLPRQQQ